MNVSAGGLAGPLVAVVLLGLVLPGCSPKRVLRTEPVTETPAALPAEIQDSAPVDYSRDNPPGEPDSGLPDPEYRGGAGTSSLEAAKTSPPGNPPPTPPAGSDLGQEAVALAQQQLGKPYQWGAEGPDKFDCSGLVMYVYDNLGVQLPRVSGQQAYAGVHVDREDLQPGDLVFFKLNGSRIDHVGIYEGHSKFIHAPRKHVPVRRESLNNSYWRRRFKGGRRLK
jgi:cell wall-associated NlpC family hydrolase